MNTKITGGLALVALIGLGGCAGEKEMSYTTDVQPILAANCLACHAPGGPGYEASGLNMVSYDDLMKGTRFGSIIVPGDATGSTLNILVEGRADKSLKMPHGKNEPLSDADIATLAAWVNQGAKNN